MSKRKNIVTVVPQRDCKEETFQITGYECPNCHGSCKEQNGLDYENPYKTCSFCNGSGKLTANVTIQWIPEINK